MWYSSCTACVQVVVQVACVRVLHFYVYVCVCACVRVCVCALHFYVCMCACTRMCVLGVQEGRGSPCVHLYMCLHARKHA